MVVYFCVPGKIYLSKINVVQLFVATRMHSTRMLTTRFSCRLGGVCLGGVDQGCLPRDVCLGGGEEVSTLEGVPCDLSHNAFDVTCMLSLHQLRLNSNAASYIVLVM